MIKQLKSLGPAIRYAVLPSGIERQQVASLSPWMITLWGLIYGIILSGVFGLSWKLFGDLYFTEYSRLRSVPMAMVILVSGVLGFRQWLGLAVTVDRLAGFDETEASQSIIPKINFPGLLAVLLVILLKYSALLAMPSHAPWWPGDWRRFFNPLYPVMHYRVLILMGLWGKAGLLIAGATGPTGPDVEEQDRMFRKKMTIKSLLANLVFHFLVTTIYFSSWRNRAIGLLVAFIIFLLVYLTSMILSWRARGHDRFSLFACAEIGEILLLLNYLAIARYL